MSATETVSSIRINAQIAEIEQQRNAALARCSNLAGQNAELIDLVKILRAEVEKLEVLIKQHNVKDSGSVIGNGSEGQDSTT